MARSTQYSVVRTDIDGTPFLGLMRELVADDGARTRAKGGVWVDLSGNADAVLARLAHAGEQALAFAAACEKTHAKLSADLATAKSGKSVKGIEAKPVKAPTPPPAKSRDAVIAKARAERSALSVAPAPRVAAPAPAKVAAFDWAAMIGQSA